MLLDVGRFIVAFWLLGESATSQRFVDAARPWHDDERYEVINYFLGAVVKQNRESVQQA